MFGIWKFKNFVAKSFLNCVELKKSWPNAKLSKTLWSKAPLFGVFPTIHYQSDSTSEKNLKPTTPNDVSDFVAILKPNLNPSGY